MPLMIRSQFGMFQAGKLQQGRKGSSRTTLALVFAFIHRKPINTGLII